MSAAADPAPSAAPAGGAPGASEPPVVALRQATVRLGGRTIWENLHVLVRQGEFVAILGANGVGKSTLLKVILGLQPLAQGQAQVLGRRPGQANSQIGYLPQRRSFGSGTRVRGVDIVRLGLDGARWGTALPLPGRRRSATRRAAGERVREVIELVGASSYARRAIGELSGGEQQRLLIAQALVRRPRLLILDEPLDSLDLATQSTITALLQRVCRNAGVAILLVAHDVNPLLGYLDRVIYLAAGRALEGPVAEVITTETLTRLHGVPIEVLASRDGRLVVVGHPEAPCHHSSRHDEDLA